MLEEEAKEEQLDLETEIIGRRKGKKTPKGKEANVFSRTRYSLYFDTYVVVPVLGSLVLKMRLNVVI